MDIYKEIALENGKTARIKKLTLGELLDFDVLSGYLKILETAKKPLVNVLYRIGDTLAERRKTLIHISELVVWNLKTLEITEADYETIYAAADEMNRRQTKEDNETPEKKYDEDWLQNLYALFAEHGYKKSDVLAMYPGEIQTMIRSFSRRDLIQMADMAAVQHSPQTIIDRLEEFDSDSNTGKVTARQKNISAKERKRLEEKYCGGNYGVRQ
jgi:hypothetical protein